MVTEALNNSAPVKPLGRAESEVTRAKTSPKIQHGQTGKPDLTSPVVCAKVRCIGYTAVSVWGQADENGGRSEKGGESKRLKLKVTKSPAKPPRKPPDKTDLPEVLGCIAESTAKAGKAAKFLTVIGDGEEAAIAADTTATRKLRGGHKRRSRVDTGRAEEVRITFDVENIAWVVARREDPNVTRACNSVGRNEAVESSLIVQAQATSLSIAQSALKSRRAQERRRHMGKRPIEEILARRHKSLQLSAFEKSQVDGELTFATNMGGVGLLITANGDGRALIGRFWAINDQFEVTEPGPSVGGVLVSHTALRSATADARLTTTATRTRAAVESHKTVEKGPQDKRSFRGARFISTVFHLADATGDVHDATAGTARNYSVSIDLKVKFVNHGEKSRNHLKSAFLAVSFAVTESIMDTFNPLVALIRSENVANCDTSRHRLQSFLRTDLRGTIRLGREQKPKRKFRLSQPNVVNARRMDGSRRRLEWVDGGGLQIAAGDESGVSRAAPAGVQFRPGQVGETTDSKDMLSTTISPKPAKKGLVKPQVLRGVRTNSRENRWRHSELSGEWAPVLGALGSSTNERALIESSLAPRERGEIGPGRIRTEARESRGPVDQIVVRRSFSHRIKDTDQMLVRGEISLSVRFVRRITIVEKRRGPPTRQNLLKGRKAEVFCRQVLDQGKSRVRRLRVEMAIYIEQFFVPEGLIVKMLTCYKIVFKGLSEKFHASLTGHQRAIESVFNELNGGGNGLAAGIGREFNKGLKSAFQSTKARAMSDIQRRANRNLQPMSERRETEPVTRKCQIQGRNLSEVGRCRDLKRICTVDRPKAVQLLAASPHAAQLIPKTRLVVEGAVIDATGGDEVVEIVLGSNWSVSASTPSTSTTTRRGVPARGPMVGNLTPFDCGISEFGDSSPSWSTKIPLSASNRVDASAEKGRGPRSDISIVQLKALAPNCERGRGGAATRIWLMGPMKAESIAQFVLGKGLKSGQIGAGGLELQSSAGMIKLNPSDAWYSARARIVVAKTAIVSADSKTDFTGERAVEFLAGRHGARALTKPRANCAIMMKPRSIRDSSDFDRPEQNRNAWVAEIGTQDRRGRTVVFSPHLSGGVVEARKRQKTRAPSIEKLKVLARPEMRVQLVKFWQGSVESSSVAAKFVVENSADGPNGANRPFVRVPTKSHGAKAERKGLESQNTKTDPNHRQNGLNRVFKADRKENWKKRDKPVLVFDVASLENSRKSAMLRKAESFDVMGKVSAGETFSIWHTTARLQKGALISDVSDGRGRIDTHFVKTRVESVEIENRIDTAEVWQKAPGGGLRHMGGIVPAGGAWVLANATAVGKVQEALKTKVRMKSDDLTQRLKVTNENETKGPGRWDLRYLRKSYLDLSTGVAKPRPSRDYRLSKTELIDDTAQVSISAGAKVSGRRVLAITRRDPPIWHVRRRNQLARLHSWLQVLQERKLRCQEHNQIALESKISDKVRFKSNHEKSRDRNQTYKLGRKPEIELRRRNAQKLVAQSERETRRETVMVQCSRLGGTHEVHPNSRNVDEGATSAWAAANSKLEYDILEIVPIGQNRLSPAGCRRKSSAETGRKIELGHEWRKPRLMSG